jgi:hypothetical protein
MAIALAAAAAAAATASQPNDPSRIFFLDIAHGGRVLSAHVDGSDVRIVTPSRAPGPDGIVIDGNFPCDGPAFSCHRIYWTTMGRVGADDGTIESALIDGGEARTLVPSGGTFTPKQIKLDSDRNQIYWADREGMRIMRADRDGSHVETLVETGHGDADRRDARNWCVGIALDISARFVYWTQKGTGGNGRIFRAPMNLGAGQTPASRTDIQLLFDGLPEPIDMDVDLTTRSMYWTDRGDAPRGNTVNRAPMDPPPGVDPAHRSDQQILFGGLEEGIGIALDRSGRRMFVTDLGGNVYRARLDGLGHETILTDQGSLTGIAYLDRGQTPAPTR